MQIRDYLHILRKGWWLILVVALFAASGSYLYTRTQTPTYQSTVRLLVQPARADLGLAEAISRLLRQYRLLLQTDQLARTVSERLKADLSPGTLQGMVTTSAVPEDFALVVQVTDTDSKRAQQIAYVLADEFVQDQAVRMSTQDPRDRVDVTMLNQPGEGQLIWPKTKTTVAAGGLFGAVLGLLLVFVLAFFDNTLKTPDDVERWAKLPTLGVVPPVPRAEKTAAEQPRPLPGAQSQSGPA